MHFFLTYTIILVVGLSLYLFKTNYLTLSDFAESYNFVNDILKRSSNSSTLSIVSEKVTEHTSIDDSNKSLNKSLRHLEFVNGLEAYTKTSEDCLLTLECLKELENSKLIAQLETLKLSSEISCLYKTKAA